jgi:acetylornithine deacetylase/succinyl-diaminopimelate desuccinylase-like protein
LANGLSRLENYKFPVVTTPTTRATFQQLAALETGTEREDWRSVATQPPNPAAADRLSQTVRLNAQLRTTCVATLISGGHAENALPQRAKATIQCRMLPGDTAENVRSALDATLNDPKITITLDAPPIISPESPPTPQLLKKVGAVVHSMWPGVLIVPTMATGFSDGRQTRNAGMPTYDLSGMWSDIDDNRAHGRNERISVQAFDESIEYTYRLMKTFASP